jgi:L-serine deaminase
MTAPVPAAAVRREAIEPTMDILAKVARARSLMSELAELVADIEHDARRSAGYLDTAHARLDEIERSGDGFMAIASEVPNGRQIAAVINGCVDTITSDPQTAHAKARTSARAQLHYLFEAFGRSIFEQRFMHHVGKARRVTLTHEYEQWHTTGRQAA